MKKLFFKPIFSIGVLFLSFSLPTQNEQFNHMREKAKKMPSWKYPYPKLPDFLKSEGKTSILIFSYGSLMDTSSAKLTLSPHSLKTRRAAIAYGIQRLFDRDVTIHPESKWCIPNNPKARAMLNVLLSDSFDSFTNGVLIDVEIDDIPNVLFREEGYDLIPVVVEEWESAVQSQNANFMIAYTFHAPQNSAFTNAKIWPRPGYYEFTRDAAAEFGPLFALVWFKTTYLGDGKTSIAEWEKKVQNQSKKTRCKSSAR